MKGVKGDCPICGKPVFSFESFISRGGIYAHYDCLTDSSKDSDTEACTQLAVSLAVRCGGSDEAIVKETKSGEDGPETYDWDEGIAP